MHTQAYDRRPASANESIEKVFSMGHSNPLDKDRAADFDRRPRYHRFFKTDSIRSFSADSRMERADRLFRRRGAWPSAWTIG